MTTLTPARPARRWMPPLVGAVAFVVVLVALGGLVGDWAARNAEMRTLVTRIEASEAAMTTFQDSVQTVLAEYAGSEALSVEDRAAIDEKLAAAAATGHDAIAAAGTGVGEVRWLSWHTEIGAAQEAYLRHSRAWQDYLARAAKDPGEIDVAQDEVNSTFAAAEGPVRAAVPALSLYDLRDRVDTIFAPPPAVSGGPTQSA